MDERRGQAAVQRLQDVVAACALVDCKRKNLRRQQPHAPENGGESVVPNLLTAPRPRGTLVRSFNSSVAIQLRCQAQCWTACVKFGMLRGFSSLDARFRTDPRPHHPAASPVPHLTTFLAQACDDRIESCLALRRGGNGV